jgi:hypothetical protein
MDALPMVSPMYKRDLKIDNYFIGYLKAPYVSYTGRGCKSRCTFCLWPQTISGHRYRSRSVGKVIEEIQYIINEIPETKEIFFDDDTLTDDIDRVEKLAIAMGELGFGTGLPADVELQRQGQCARKTLEMKANGCRLLLVGYESGNQQILHNIKKGLRVEVARVHQECHELGMPSTAPSSSVCPAKRWKRSRKPSVRIEINPHTIQVSLAAPYPGTFLYNQALENGWFAGGKPMTDDGGHQIAQLSYPHLPARDPRQGRGILQALLFPPAQDRRHRQ